MTTEEIRELYKPITQALDKKLSEAGYNPKQIALIDMKVWQAFREAMFAQP